MTTAPAVPPSSRLVAEGLGSFVLVLGGVGAALLSAPSPSEQGALAPGIALLATAAAFGLAMAAASTAFGRVSGGHFTPVLTLGFAAAGRIGWGEAARYVAVQVIGAVVATTVIVLIGLFGPAGWLEQAQNSGFASNGWGALSPGGFDLPAAVIAELVLTAVLVLVVLGAAGGERGTSAVPLASGLTLALIHLVAIPIDNASVNPARSIATALYGGAPALGQLWAFVVVPVVGALLAGWAHRAVFDDRP